MELDSGATSRQPQMDSTFCFYHIIIALFSDLVELPDCRIALFTGSQVMAVLSIYLHY